MIDFATLLAYLMMGCRWQNFLVSLPKVTETGAALICGWNAVPQVAASLGTPVAQDKSQDLAGAPAHDRPQPTFVFAIGHKRPQFIIFELVFMFCG